MALAATPSKEAAAAVVETPEQKALGGDGSGESPGSLSATVVSPGSSAGAAIENLGSSPVQALATAGSVSSSDGLDPQLLFQKQRSRALKLYISSINQGKDTTPPTRSYKSLITLHEFNEFFDRFHTVKTPVACVGARAAAAWQPMGQLNSDILTKSHARVPKACQGPGRPDPRASRIVASLVVYPFAN